MTMKCGQDLQKTSLSMLNTLEIWAKKTVKCSCLWLTKLSEEINSEQSKPSKAWSILLTTTRTLTLISTWHQKNSEDVVRAILSGIQKTKKRKMLVSKSVKIINSSFNSPMLSGLKTSSKVGSLNTTRGTNRFLKKCRSKKNKFKTEVRI